MDPKRRRQDVLNTVVLPTISEHISHHRNLNEHAEDYQVVEQNLEGLPADIPYMTLEEVPRRDQRHTVGVSAAMSRLLRRVARAVMCYRECHP